MCGRAARRGCLWRVAAAASPAVGGGARAKRPRLDPNEEPLLVALRTRNTPIVKLHWTPKGLLIAVGAFSADGW